MKVLIIRRENIGDLILTTPLISILSRNHQVDMLVNSYNKLVLIGNPNVTKIHHYTKLHHEGGVVAKVLAFLHRIKTTFNVWREGYDVAIVAGNWNKRPLIWARISRAKKIIAIGDDAPDVVTNKLPYSEGVHMVEQLAELAKPLESDIEIGKLELFLSQKEIEKASYKIPNTYHVPVYGLQISSRKEKQRWSVESFIDIAHKLAQREVCKIVLFWSPGSSDVPGHPGDDAKAEYILNHCKGIMMTPYSTVNIRELMAGMSLCDQIITSDGGALHIAAGVGRPVVALFGNSDSLVWGPWKVPCRIISSPIKDVSKITVNEVLEKFVELREEVIHQRDFL